MERVVLIFDQQLERISRWGLILSLFVLLSFAVLSIVLRWFGVSPMWIEPLVRHVVFISAFLGGSLATSKNVHIKVDLLTHVVEASPYKIIHWLHRNIISLFCLITTSALSYSAFNFYLMEKEFGSEAFLGIHSSVLVAIIPFGLGLIALRYFNKLILGIVQGDVRESNRL